MESFTQSIKLKIDLAFGACVAQMAVVGIFGIHGLWKISAASEEQSRGIKRVNLAVMQTDEVTQQNAALAEEAAASAQSLEGQARNLGTAISVFKVADAGLAVSRVVLRHSESRVARPGRSVTSGNVRAVEKTSDYGLRGTARSGSNATAETWDNL